MTKRGRLSDDGSERAPVTTGAREGLSSKVTLSINLNEGLEGTINVHTLLSIE